VDLSPGIAGLLTPGGRAAECLRPDRRPVRIGASRMWIKGGAVARLISSRRRYRHVSSGPLATAAALGWFIIACCAHQSLISRATGAKGVRPPKRLGSTPRSRNSTCASRADWPCRRCGSSMPRRSTPTRSGLRKGQYANGHPRTSRCACHRWAQSRFGARAHAIRNRDTQLMVMAVIFAGIIALSGGLVIGGWFLNGGAPTSRRGGNWGAGPATTPDNLSTARGGPAALIARLIAHLDDTGSAELTKNPGALIRALVRIERHASFGVPSRIQAFFIENPVASRVSGLFSTSGRLRRYAGALREPSPVL